MPKAIKVRGSDIQFPQVCVVCTREAKSTYTIERTLIFGRRSQLLRFPVPMCEEHRLQALHKGTAERLVEWIGLVVGALVGLASGGWLILYWSNTHQGSLLLNIPLAVIVGGSIGFTFWAAVYFFLAPLFADHAAKGARQAVRIAMYWPRDGIVELAFANETYAGMFARVNESRLVSSNP